MSGALNGTVVVEIVVVVKSVGRALYCLACGSWDLIALLVLLLLRAHGSFVSQFVAGEADDWKERKIRLRCR